MTVEEMQEAVQKLRTVELHRAVRGVDPEQARKLIDEAADLLAAAAREQDQLSRRVERLRDANDESAVGRALVTATRAGEAVIAEAREQAASLSAEAEAHATALLEEVRTQAERREQETEAAREQFERELADARKAHSGELESARAEANEALAAARRELAELEQQAEQLRSLVVDLERRIMEIAQGALEELEALGAPMRNQEGDLLADLQPAAEPSDVTAD